jgi:hypothetical protein
MNTEERKNNGVWKVWEYFKLHLVEAILISILSTMLIKNCSSHSLITESVLPEIDTLGKDLVKINKQMDSINRHISTISLVVDRVTIDIDAIKSKYIHPENHGIKCEVRQSRYIKENEIGIHPDNEYKLSGSKQILIMNTNSANSPSVKLTVTTDIKVDENDSKDYFYLNKKTLLQLGIDTQINKRGVYNLRFFND